MGTAPGPAAKPDPVWWRVAALIGLARGTVRGMTSLASREGEIPFDDAPGRWHEVADRVDKHGQLRLVRGADAPALVVMTEDDFDQAMEDAADLALCREILSRMEPVGREQAEAEHAEFVAFLEGI